MNNKLLQDLLYNCLKGLPLPLIDRPLNIFVLPDTLAEYKNNILTYSHWNQEKVDRRTGKSTKAKTQDPILSVLTYLVTKLSVPLIPVVKSLFLAAVSSGISLPIPIFCHQFVVLTCT